MFAATSVHLTSFELQIYEQLQSCSTSDYLHTSYTAVLLSSCLHTRTSYTAVHSCCGALRQNARYDVRGSFVLLG